MHWIIFATVLLLPATALANVIFPTIVFSLPLQILALIPVIFIEAWVICRQIPQRTFKKVLSTTAIANIATTVLGNPIAWVFAACLSTSAILLSQVMPKFENQTATTILNTIGYSLFFTTWLYDVPRQYPWTFFIGFIILFILSYIVSWRIEYWVFKKIWKDKDVSRQLQRAVRLANRISYGIICIVLIVWAVKDASIKVSP